MEEDQVSEVQISMVRLFDTDLGDDSSGSGKYFGTFAIFKDVFNKPL
jgi:hypothetical protein